MWTGNPHHHCDEMPHVTWAAATVPPAGVASNFVRPGPPKRKTPRAETVMLIAHGQTCIVRYVTSTKPGACLFAQSPLVMQMLPYRFFLCLAPSCPGAGLPSFSSCIVEIWSIRATHTWGSVAIASFRKPVRSKTNRATSSFFFCLAQPPTGTPLSSCSRRKPWPTHAILV